MLNLFPNPANIFFRFILSTVAYQFREKVLIFAFYGCVLRYVQAVLIIAMFLMWLDSLLVGGHFSVLHRWAPAFGVLLFCQFFLCLAEYRY